MIWRAAWTIGAYRKGRHGNHRRGSMNNMGSMDYWTMVCRSSWCGSIAGKSFTVDILFVSRWFNHFWRKLSVVNMSGQTLALNLLSRLKSYSMCTLRFSILTHTYSSLILYIAWCYSPFIVLLPVTKLSGSFIDVLLFKWQCFLHQPDRLVGLLLSA